jgi:hypothetical protein
MDHLGGAFIAVALNSLHLISIHKRNSVGFFLLEAKFVVFVDQLHLIDKLMGAHFIRLEKVDVVNLFAHSKLPETVHLLSKAVDRLVCRNAVY